MSADKLAADEPSVDQLPADHVTTLRDHDLQVTAQRLAVLRAVTAHPHGTANELADEVRSEIGAISRQSVYDTLTLLTERNVLRRIQTAGSPARYEDRVGDNHHHLVCRHCDRLVDVDCAVGEMPCLVPVDSGDFIVDEAEVIYWGICPDCQTSSPASGDADLITHTEQPEPVQPRSVQPRSVQPRSVQPKEKP